MNIDLTKTKYGKDIKKYFQECVRQLKRRTRNNFSNIIIDHQDGSFFLFRLGVVFTPHFITNGSEDGEKINSFAYVFSPNIHPLLFFRDDLFTLSEFHTQTQESLIKPQYTDINIPSKFSKHFSYKNLNQSLFIGTRFIMCSLKYAKHVVVNENLIAITEHNGCFRFPMKEIEHFSSADMNFKGF